jgi:hypothetical protein
VFNIGDHFKVDSSTGYVLALAALGSLLPMEWAIRTLGAVSIAATVAALGYLAATAEAGLPRRLVAAIAPIPYVAVAAYEGMETPLACALIALGAIAWRRERPALCILITALAAAVRFEALALLALCLAQSLPGSPRKGRLLAAAAPLAALFAFELWQFGSIVPHAALAKSHGYNMPLWLSAMFGLWLKWGWQGLWAGIALLAAIGSGISRMAARRRMARADAYLLFAAAVFAGWMLSRSLIFLWYYCMLAVPLAIWVLWADAVPRAASWAQRMGTPLACVALAGFFGFGLDATLGSVSGGSDIVRVPRYAQIGAALEDLCPRCTLASSEIGAVGYTFPGTVYDGFGIADPVAMQFHPLRIPFERRQFDIGGIPARYIELRRPDFIVTMPPFALGLLGSPTAAHYSLYECPFGDAAHPVSFWNGEDRALVLALRPLPAATLAAMRCAPPAGAS